MNLFPYQREYSCVNIDRLIQAVRTWGFRNAFTGSDSLMKVHQIRILCYAYELMVQLVIYIKKIAFLFDDWESICSGPKLLDDGVEIPNSQGRGWRFGS